MSDNAADQLFTFVLTVSFPAGNVIGELKCFGVSALKMKADVSRSTGPQTFLDKDAPRYSTALAVFTGCIIVAVFTMLAIWVINIRRNRANEAIRSAPGYVALQNQEFLDLTDR